MLLSAFIHFLSKTIPKASSVPVLFCLCCLFCSLKVWVCCRLQETFYITKVFQILLLCFAFDCICLSPQTHVWYLSCIYFLPEMLYSSKKVPGTSTFTSCPLPKREVREPPALLCCCWRRSCCCLSSSSLIASSLCSSNLIASSLCSSSLIASSLCSSKRIASSLSCSRRSSSSLCCSASSAASLCCS